MTLDEAIKHCEEVADTPCFTDEEARCYSEHRQLAEWLKELKAYREQSGDAISRQNAIFLASDLKQDLPDDERIADMVMAHNEGILEYQTQLSLLASVTPQPCEDCISRQAAIKAIEALQRPIMREESNYYQFKFSGMSEALDVVKNLPSVTPQQKTGRWIQKEEEGDAEPFIIWECSECHCVDEDGKPSYKYCPQCGARMEVEDAD